MSAGVPPNSGWERGQNRKADPTVTTSEKEHKSKILHTQFNQRKNRNATANLLLQRPFPARIPTRKEAIKRL